MSALPIDVALGLYIVAFMLVGALFAIRAERHEWNGGVCVRCASKWERFDTDSQGCRGYACRICSPTRYIWISWPVDKA